MARELAAGLVNAGEYADAAEVAGAFGLPGIELAGGEFADVIELSNRQINAEQCPAASALVDEATGP